MDAESVVATACLMHDIGDVTSKFEAILKIISGRAMLVPQCKHLTTQILQAKWYKKDTYSNVLLAILDIMKDRIEKNFNSSSSGTSNVIHNLL